MPTESRQFTVDGQLLREGTSLFVERTSEVLWITEMTDEYVHVDTVRESHVLEPEKFEKLLVEEDLVVESRHPGPYR